MGAKLSKKKKGYCLGAGKDGESTETTEVEQKETETQVGQKDAAEPNGETPPTDPTPNNGASEEQKAHVEKNSTEDPSGDTTKDDLNEDQKSESKPSAEQKKVEESNQDEHGKSSTISQQTTEGGKEVKSQPEEKQTDHGKEKESLAKDEPTQEHKSAIEQESLEPKQSDKSVTKPSAPVPDQKEVAKPVPDPETKVKVEKMEKEQTQVPTAEHLSQQATKEQTPVTDSVKEPERLNEKVEQLVLETAVVAPVLQETVPASVVELTESELVKKVVEPETTEVSIPETQSLTDLVKPESPLAPEPMIESVESKASDEPAAPVPKVESVEPVANSELVPCPEHEQLSSTKPEVEPIPEPPPSNEVPDSTAHTEENVKNHKILGNDDLGTKLVEIPAATTESEPAEQPSAEKIPGHNSSVAENGFSKQAAEDIQEDKAQEVDKEMQNEVKEESVSDKQPIDHASLERGCKDTEEVPLDTSKNVNDQVTSEDTTVHDATQDKNCEDKTENHEIPAEEVAHKPSAPLLVDKHGVGNGLPLKEDVKEHLENECDIIFREFNGQGDGHEIAVCNE